MFDAIPEAMIFGEDVGKIGGVNQGVEGLQDKFGESRVADTGIREATIIGQGIGLSLRGLKANCRNAIFGLCNLWFSTYGR